MSAAVQQAFRKGDFRILQLAEIEHPDGTGYFHNGWGYFEHRGNRYSGVAEISQVTEVVTSTAIEITEVTFQLSGLDPDLVAKLSKSIKGQRALFYEVVLDGYGRVIDEELVSETLQDFARYVISDQRRVSIEIKAHGGLYFLRSKSSAKMSNEEQKLRYPDDTGFSEIHLQPVANWRAA